MSDKWEQTNCNNLEKHYKLLSTIYKVSTIVIARRALDFNLIRQEEFTAYYKKLVKIWRQKKEEVPSGGSIHNSFPVAKSTTSTNSVCHAVFSGDLLLRNGARLLVLDRQLWINMPNGGGCLEIPSRCQCIYSGSPLLLPF